MTKGKFMKKRLISLLLVLILAFSILPIQAFGLTTGNETWETAKNYVYENIKKSKTNIDITKYGIKEADINNFAQEIRDLYPDLFYADLSGYICDYSTRLVKSLKITYNALNTTDAKAAYENAINDALLFVNDKMSDLQKTLALHDYLVKNTVYDETTTLDSHSAYSALVSKVAVCDGYAKAFSDLLSRCGIENYLVRSTSMNHVWNHVYINEQWYNVDVTWDDPTPDRGNNVSYKFFMLSDEAMLQKEHNDWTAYYQCTDTTYDHALYWKDTYNKMPKETDIFTDVYNDDFFVKAVLWAYENKITTGTSATSFSPMATCTRGQAMTFLWRVAGEPVPEGVNARSKFKDVNRTDWFFRSTTWACEQNITNGTSATTFSPNRNCSIAEIITFLYRAKGSPEVSISSDKYAGQYYEAAMTWAESKGFFDNIPAGFKPEDNCPRAYIVYFLYQCK